MDMVVSQKSCRKKAAKAAVMMTIPMMVGFLLIGIAYGLMMASKGYGPLWSILNCVVIFSGAGQFLVADLLVPGVSLINVVVLSFFISVRHVAYGLSMLAPFREISRGKRWYMIFVLGDEAFSYYCSNQFPPDVDKKQCMFYIALLLQIYWIVGAGLGGLCGNAIQINTEGVDFVMTALFVTIFLDQWKASRSHTPAVAGVLISVVCLAVFGSDSFVLPAMVAIMVVLLACRKRLGKEMDENVS